MTMKALEAACRGAGLPGTRSILATGNLIVPSDCAPADVEMIFARCLAAGGLQNGWLRRTGDAIAEVARAGRAAKEFAEVLRDRPARVQVHFLPGPVPDAALETLRDLDAGARIARLGGEVLIDYGGAISTSALTLPRIDRALGRGQTARNWNTIRKIEAALCPWP